MPSHRGFYGAERMYRNKWLIPAVCFSLLFGCASRPKTDTTKSTSETTKAANAKIPPAQAAVRSVKTADGSIMGEIVGIPGPGSKFARLQIGMSREQVETLIGQPNDTDSRITGKQFQPFYFDGDTQRTEAYYKNEGQLTFSNIHPDNAADTLIRIMVNPDASGNQ
jgi:hypothetical protein